MTVNNVKKSVSLCLIAGSCSFLGSITGSGRRYRERFKKSGGVKWVDLHCFDDTATFFKKMKREGTISLWHANAMGKFSIYIQCIYKCI